MQRRSPPVHYPVRRCAVLWWVWFGLLAGNAVLLLVWLHAGAGMGWVLFGGALLGGGLWLLAGVCSWQALRSLPQGVLSWDGQHWGGQWQQGAQSLEGAPQVLLDMQRLLVLCWALPKGGCVRVVLQRDWAPQAWMGVRRAVYSSADPSAGPPGSALT